MRGSIVPTPQLATVPSSACPADPLDLLKRHADHSSAFLAMNDDTSHFVSGDGDGLVSYASRLSGHAVQFGGLYTAPDRRRALLEQFSRTVGSRSVVAVQVLEEDRALYEDAGFTTERLGSSYSCPLEGYGLGGRKFVKTRNMISRGRREDVTVHEVRDDSEPRLAAELRAIDGEWLAGKGPLTREYRHMVGQRGGRGAAERRVFLAVHRGQVVAYVSFSPVFGRRQGWLYDLTRRRGSAPPGTIELVMWTAIQQFQEEGAGWLHLGFTPFAGLPSNGTGALAGLLRQLRQRGDVVYPSASQERFKRKWRPEVVEPEHVAFSRLAPVPVLHLLRVIRAF